MFRRKPLPHLDVIAPQFVTFRAADTLCGPHAPSPGETWDDILDVGHGSRPFQGAAATLVEHTILHEHRHTYVLHAWCVMPNHVHVLLTTREPLNTIVAGWKRLTAKRLNAAQGRKGPVWARDFFDRYMRHAEHFVATCQYIHHNPVKAGLCATPSAWGASSARFSELVEEAAAGRMADTARAEGRRHIEI